MSLSGTTGRPRRSLAHRAGDARSAGVAWCRERPAVRNVGPCRRAPRVPTFEPFPRELRVAGDRVRSRHGGPVGAVELTGRDQPRCGPAVTATTDGGAHWHVVAARRRPLAGPAGDRVGRAAPPAEPVRRGGCVRPRPQHHSHRRRRHVAEADAFPWPRRGIHDLQFVSPARPRAGSYTATRAARSTSCCAQSTAARRSCRCRSERAMIRSRGGGVSGGAGSVTRRPSAASRNVAPEMASLVRRRA